jgi:hypothetical protein
VWREAQTAHDELSLFEGVLWVTASTTAAAKETTVPEEGVDEACDAAWHACTAAAADVVFAGVWASHLPQHPHLV